MAGDFRRRTHSISSTPTLLKSPTIEETLFAIMPSFVVAVFGLFYEKIQVDYPLSTENFGILAPSLPIFAFR
ncbi:TPA: hypothetical protein ACS70L_002696 [Providencia alcalifaciens]